MSATAVGYPKNKREKQEAIHRESLLWAMPRHKGETPFFNFASHPDSM